MKPDLPSRVSLYPLLWLAACFGLGIVAAHYLDPDVRYLISFIVLFGLLAFLCALSGFAVSKSGSPASRTARKPGAGEDGLIKEIKVGGRTAAACSDLAAAACLLIAFLLLGAATYQLQIESVADNRLKRIYGSGRIESFTPLELEGIVRGGPEPAHGGYFLRLEAEKISKRDKETAVSGIVRLFVSASDPEKDADFKALDLRHGSRIRVACAPEREERLLNPGVVSRIGLLDQQGIDAAATVKSPLLIEKISDGGVSFFATLLGARQVLINSLRENFSTSTAGIMIASLLGDKYFLDRYTADIFREGGTFHILVISGLHITFIGGLAVLAVGRFTRRRSWKFLVPTLLLWTYTFAVGADVPVVRASVMFTVLLFAYLIYRQGTLLNSLGLCTLLLLTWRPEDVFNPSFQLTFVSVAAIVACAFPLIEKLRAIGSWSPDVDRPFPPHVPAWMKRFSEMLYWQSEKWEIEAGRQIWSARIFKSPYLRWLEASGMQAAAAFVFEGILVSLIVQVWLLPLLVWYFHRISPAAILLNLWVGLFIAIESFLALTAVFLLQLSDWLAFPFVQITELVNSLLLGMPKLLAVNDWASLRVPVYSGSSSAIYLLYFIPLIIAAVGSFKWDPLAFRAGDMTARRFASKAMAAGSLIAVGLASIIVFHPFSEPIPNGRLTVDFLDVGQGDAAFITFPDGRTMLIDGGGRTTFRDEEDGFEPDVMRIGEAVVSEFLWEKGYSGIDYLVATHADTDHMQGITDVARNFRIGSVLLGRDAAGDPDFEELYDVIVRKNLSVEFVCAGQTFEIGGTRLDVLFPLGSESAEHENDNSIVMRIAYGQRVFLFTGDVEQAGETRLLASGAELRADVVKVSHHGSRTSSTPEFVRAVEPSVALVPVGRRSIHGHPHPEVVDRWRHSGARVLTTGEQGTVNISTDGNDLNVSTFK